MWCGIYIGGRWSARGIFHEEVGRYLHMTRGGRLDSRGPI